MITESHPSSGSLLLIGETSDNLASLLVLLSEYGYAVRSTSPDRPLSEIIIASQPDVILMTLEPLSDGYALCQHFKQSPDLQKIPILLIATEAHPLEVPRLFQAGAADYVSYPIQREELIARIEQQLTLGRLQAQLTEKSHLLQQIENALCDVNEGFIATTTLAKLTESLNRQEFEDHLAREWRRYARERVLWGESTYSHVSLIIGELDRLALYRDQFGLKTQQTFMQEIENTIRPILKRPADYFIRYDRDRFAILLPNTDEEGALQVIYMIQEAIAQLNLFPPLPDPLTLSFGLATGIPAYALPSETLLKSAIHALDQALDRGGDQVISDCI